MPRDQEPFLALDMSTTCPRNGPKVAKNGLNVRCLRQTDPKPRTGRILGYVVPNRIPRAPSPPASPHFLWFPSFKNFSTRRLDPRSSGHLLEPEGSAARAQLGPTVGAPGSPGRKNHIFSKVVLRPLGMLKQVFLGRFEAVVARYGPYKFPKCLENGPFQDQQWVKNGSKTHFSNRDPPTSDFSPF